MTRRTKKARIEPRTERVQLNAKLSAVQRRGRKRVARAAWNPETFRVLRQASGWSMEALATKLGVSLSTLYNMQGLATFDPPTVEMAARIAKLLKIDVDTFAGKLADLTFTVTHKVKK